MKIERINENTLKFYISYLDIEDRGFDIEEIWFNKERSEELFWQIMDEAHSQESFSLEGPLWIRVQALEKGMEILVTRAQISKDGANLQIPVSPDKHLEIPVRNDGESGLEDGTETDLSDGENDRIEQTEDDSPNLTFIIEFKDIEDLITLSHALDLQDQTASILYAYHNKYYLQVIFSEDSEEEEQDALLSRILEYGLDTGVTESVIEEYGKKIIAEQALQLLKAKFPRLN
nr:adaptor protein MecA [Sporolactobacillus spathodeae]